MKGSIKPNIYHIELSHLFSTYHCWDLDPVSKFNEFEPRLKSTKNWFQFSAGLNLETMNTILSGTTIFEPWLKFKLRLKFFKFGL